MRSCGAFTCCGCVDGLWCGVHWVRPLLMVWCWMTMGCIVRAGGGGAGGGRGMSNSGCSCVAASKGRCEEHYILCAMQGTESEIQEQRLSVKRSR